jgi:DamX protein
MDTGFLAALEDDQVADSLINALPFSPPNLSSSQLTQLELLQHLSLYSELLILVCAEKGKGKTFIAKALLASREIPDQGLMFEADFSLTYLDVLHNLAQFLDLAELADDLDSIEQQVLAQCLKIAAEDQGSVLLIIDQTDQLSDDVLENINQLALLAPNALRIMLLAPLGFENKLLVLADPQAPFHVMEIEALSGEEAEVLLLEQYPDKEWDAEQLDYIIQQSAGNPGKILYLARQLISGIKPQQVDVEASKFPITHIAAMVLVASFLIIAYLYQDSFTAVEPQSEIAVLEITAPEADSPFSSEPEVANLALGIVEEEPTEITGKEVILSEEVDFNFAQPEIVNVPQVAQKAVLKEAVSIGREVAYSKQEQILLLAESSEFVIQLFGSYSAKSAQTFISDNTTEAIQLSRYETQHKGKLWHVVIAGPFESKITATQQSKRLSTRLRQQKPWIRSIAPIQTDLKSRN